MCRWLTILVLSHVIYSVCAYEHDEKNSLLTRHIHPRRHKRTEQVRPMVPLRPSPFTHWHVDERCMPRAFNRPMMSCPQRDPLEPLRCIEFEELCDDHMDCPGGEDEQLHFCMFKKLEDMEINRLMNKIRELNKSKLKGAQSETQFKEISTDQHIVHSEPDEEEQEMVEIQKPKAPGVFKMQPGSGPLGGGLLGAFAKTEYEEDDEEEEDEEQETYEDLKKENARKHARRKRAFRHLLNLRVARR